MKIAKVLTVFVLMVFWESTAFAVSPIETLPDVSGLPEGLRHQIERLRGLSPKERADAARTLGDMGEASIPAIPFLIQALSDHGTIDGPDGHISDDESLRADAPRPSLEAAHALGKIGEPAVRPLIAALKQEFPTVSWCPWPDLLEKFGQEYIHTTGLGEAELALVEIGEPAVEPLIEALQRDNHVLRTVAASALGRIRDRRATEPLIRTLQDKDPYVRRSAVIALGGIGGNRAVEPLIQCLADPEWHVRRKVPPSLGRIKDERAIAPLIESLSEDDVGLLCGAARTLGRMESMEAVEPLLALLNHPDGGVRVASNRALDSIREKREKTEPWPERYEYRKSLKIADILEFSLSTDKAEYKLHEPVELTFTLTNKTNEEVAFWRPEGGHGPRYLRITIAFAQARGFLYPLFRNPREVFPEDPVRIGAGQSHSSTKTIEPYHASQHTVTGSFEIRQTPHVWRGILRAKPVYFTIRETPDSDRLLKMKYDRLMALCKKENPATFDYFRLLPLGPKIVPYLETEIKASENPRFRERMEWALKRITERASTP